MKKHIVSVITIILTVIISGTSVSNAVTSYKSYNYSYFNSSQVFPSPAPYVPSLEINEDILGVQLKGPEDMAVTDDGYTLILDTGNNRIIVLDPDWKLDRIIDGFRNGEETDTFNKPRGLFVTQKGNIYVADTENSRIVELDWNGELVRIIGKPEAEIIKSDAQYFPVKLVVDKRHRIYVIARNVFEGLIELDKGGKFFAYTGSNRVRFNPIDLFWKRIATREQIEKMIMFVPVEYTNIDIDENGFMYTVSAAGQTGAPIKRLNSSGIDVLIRDGYHSPRGDLIYTWGGSMPGPSALVDICIDNDDVYRVLDSKRGRVFTYDPSGNLLFVFGGRGDQFGTFNSPVAISKKGEQLLVLDSRKNSITVFNLTDYGRQILQGVKLYQQGHYIEASEVWKKVLNLNSNYELAYIQIGKSYLRQDRYEEAMENFRLGKDRKNYSKAFIMHRKELMRKFFGPAMTILLILILIVLGIKVWKKKQLSWKESYLND